MVRRVLGAPATTTVSGALLAPVAAVGPAAGAPGSTGMRAAARAGAAAVVGADRTAPFVWLTGAGLALAVLAGGGWALTRNRRPAAVVNTDDTPAHAPGRREVVVPAGEPLIGSGLQGKDRA